MPSDGCRDSSVRHPDAARVGAERVARGGERPGSRASTELGVLTGPAGTHERRVPDLSQHGVVAVDLDQTLVPDIPQSQRHESRRVDIAVGSDEDDPLAVPRRRTRSPYLSLIHISEPTRPY